MIKILSKSFIFILCLVTFCIADVSEVTKSGYNYPKPDPTPSTSDRSVLNVIGNVTAGSSIELRAMKSDKSVDKGMMSANSSEVEETSASDSAGPAVITLGSKMDQHCMNKTMLDTTAVPQIVQPSPDPKQQNMVVTNDKPFSNVFNEENMKSSMTGPSGISVSEPTVSKRFFTFTAVDEGTADDDDIDEDKYSSVRSSKNYDVIFVKAPATAVKSTLKAVSQYAGQQQTDIYILSQQFGSHQIGSALRTSGIKPNRPVVRFIKYSTPQEQALAQQRIRAYYNTLNGPNFDGGSTRVPVKSVIGSFGYQNPRYYGKDYQSSTSNDFAKFHSNGYRKPLTNLYDRAPMFSEGFGSSYLPPRY